MTKHKRRTRRTRAQKSARPEEPSVEKSAELVDESGEEDSLEEIELVETDESSPSVSTVSSSESSHGFPIPRKSPQEEITIAIPPEPDREVAPSPRVSKISGVFAGLVKTIVSPFKKRTDPVVWLRRLVQLAFFVLFIYLFLETVFHPADLSLDETGDIAIGETGGPVKLFFELDPLVMITTWIASHTIPTALLLALTVLVLTALTGRWFCGWICPFGALHNFFTSLRGGRKKAMIDRGGYTTWHKSKYYILIVFLAAALIGINVVGWLDPFSFFYRALAVALFPAFNWAVVAFSTWVYEADPGIGPLRLTLITEPLYAALRNNVLAVEQPFYHSGVLIGFLFIGIVALNFFRPRFWCRYICPLGALLGITGKNPTVRLIQDENVCTQCNLCLADCQGGADPHAKDGWKPAECFYCWNCKSSCPVNAISFQTDIPERKK